MVALAVAVAVAVTSPWLSIVSPESPFPGSCIETSSPWMPVDFAIAVVPTPPKAKAGEGKSTFVSSKGKLRLTFVPSAVAVAVAVMVPLGPSASATPTVMVSLPSPPWIPMAVASAMGEASARDLVQKSKKVEGIPSAPMDT
ncbi:MAG: hypothetical protein U9N83_07975, partial [Thermodesulfobacteriota bacterium]|nr:hypothetical protein [Thermodesulfobacteriota bacterium]